MAATAPFLPDETKPADTDVVSQYPAIERTYRDIMESWMLIDHDATTGGHEQLTLVDQASDPTFAAGQIGVWNNAGILNTRIASGTVSQVGIPAGVMVDYAGASAPNGWLLAFGQCVTRSAPNVALFAALSTLYDNGCSGSEFGIPDTRGRTTVGEDDMGGTSANRLTGLTGGVNGDMLGATGGLETFTLAITNLAAHAHTLSAHTHTIAHTHTYNKVTNISEQGQSGNHSGTTQETSQVTSGVSAGSSGLPSVDTTNSIGSTTAKGHIQPTIVFMKIIKL